MAIGNSEIAHRVADWLPITAVVVIAVAVVVAVVGAAVLVLRKDSGGAVDAFRNRMGRGLLIGLDILIAADIIETVTLEPTIENIAGLGVLVVIRTFLSWAIFLEIEERWPWQSPVGRHRADRDNAPGSGPDRTSR